MKLNKVGWTDLFFSEIGLGTWVMGGSGWKYSLGQQDDQNSIRTIHKAVELGVNWIDAAPVYGLGHAEEIICDALKDLSVKPFITTKFSLRWDCEGNIEDNLCPESIKEEVEGSLKRLNVEIIDLYQMHWPRPNERIEEAWYSIGKLVKEGKIRYAGVCNFSVEQLCRIQAIYPIATVQSPYSILRRDIEFDLLSYCELNQIGVLAYSPLQKGLLTDNLSKSWLERHSPDDRRLKDKNFNEPRLSEIIALVENLKMIAKIYHRSVSELAIAWVLRRPEITAAIVGARRPEQIEHTLNASGWGLSIDDIDAIEKLINQAR